MGNLGELLDSLLTLAVSYPFTIWRSLFNPEAVFGQAQPLTSSPGATFVVSFMVWYVAHATSLKIQVSPDLKLPTVPDKGLLVKVFLIVAVSLSTQYLCLRIPNLVPSPPSDAVATVKLLSYPISVSSATYGVVYLGYLLSPFGKWRPRLAFGERLDPVLRQVRAESGRPRIVAHENASSLATLSALATYVIVLYGYVSVVFHAAFVRSGVIVVTLASAFFIVFCAVSYVVGKRYGDVIKELHGRSEKLALEDGKSQEKERASGQ